MLALLDAWLIAPFDYGFMRRAVVGGLALSLAAPPLGVFLVLRGMSLIGDAMAHAVLPGVVLDALLGAEADDVVCGRQRDRALGRVGGDHDLDVGVALRKGFHLLFERDLTMYREQTVLQAGNEPRLAARWRAQ